MSAVYVIASPDFNQAEGLDGKRMSSALCSFLLVDGKLTEVHMEQGKPSLLGNIYVGKVKNVLKNIEAAFVEIAGGRTCFLPLSEAASPILTNRVYDGRLLAGDEILVQVKKDAVKTKDPVLTAKLSVTGRYAALAIDGGQGIRYSHKLTAEERAAAKDSLAGILVPKGMTLVVRTEFGALSDSSVLAEETEILIKRAEKLLTIGKTRTVYSLISEECPGYFRHLQQCSPAPDKIITDELSIYTALQNDLHPAEGQEVVFYEDEKISLSRLYGLGAKLEEALSKKVWLKSGGYLVIEPTEALTVIDVNSGKFTGKKKTEETFALINEEAAWETARQLRLRNLSGIILVDFINQEGREAKQHLLSVLRCACSQDPVPVQVVDMTALGLVEITRKKVERPLLEQIQEIQKERTESK